jgi:hypothetical protein
MAERKGPVLHSTGPLSMPAKAVAYDNWPL